jgi:hypothetical protein
MPATSDASAVIEASGCLRVSSWPRIVCLSKKSEYDGKVLVAELCEKGLGRFSHPFVGMLRRA